jgi:DNA-binding transcriptional ArsR family regulator
VYDRAPPTARKWNVIDRLREQIQERLDQLVAEADRLRKALAALGPGSAKAPADTPARRKRAAASASKPAAASTGSAAPRPASAARAVPRTAPGATKASVLTALAGGEAMTAGEVATKAGLARATVSTTLSKLAKTGEVHKAERGYRLTSTAGE